MNEYRASARHLLLAAAASAALSACAAGGASGDGAEMAAAGHDDHGGPAAAPVDGASQLTVAATSFAFQPAELVVEAGEPVDVALQSTDVLHDLNLDEVGFHVAADAGETVTAPLVVEQPGEYTVYCSVPGHRQAGMEATLVVR